MKVGKLLITLLCLAVIGYIAFNELTKNKVVSPPENKIIQLIGHYDNYQFSKDDNASHYHIQIDSASANEYKLEMKISNGSDKSNLLSSQIFDIKKNSKGYYELHAPNRKMSTIKDTDAGFESLDGFIKLSGDTLIINHLAGSNVDKPIKALKSRYFSGWFQIIDSDNPNKNLLVENLKLHDQGDQLDLNFGDENYMLKLSNEIANSDSKRLMLSLYNIPSDSITNQSNPIIQSWTSPVSNKIGIDIGEVVSEWTLVKMKVKDTTKKKKKKKKK